MNDKEQMYYKQGKIDGVKEFVKELKNHSCSYDLEEWMDFDAVNVDVIDKLTNDYINKILAESTKSDTTFTIGENKIDRTFTPEEIWNALCKVIRTSSSEDADGIVILCEEIFGVPAPQIERKLYSDGIISDLYYRNYDEDDI